MITGIVDLESVRGGDPLSDLAGWSLQEHPLLTTALLTGYFGHPPDEATRVALTLYRLRIASALLRFHLSRGELFSAATKGRQIQADLDDLAAATPRALPRITSATWNATSPLT
jgi:aminoglycoside phosphotransferase (APT) family kinase protein